MKRYSTNPPHQRNANENHNEISSYTCQNSYHEKDNSNKSWQECGGKGIVGGIVGGNVNWCGHPRKQYENSSKILSRTTIWSSNSTPRHLSEENENINYKRYIHLYVCCIIYSIQDMEATKVPINRWVNREDMVYTMQYYVAIIMIEILPFWTTRMDLKCTILSEISQTEKDEYCIISLIGGIQKLKKWTNVTKQKHSHRYREQTGGGQRDGGWERERNRWGDLRGTSPQLQNKWVMDIKCTGEYSQ